MAEHLIAERLTYPLNVCGQNLTAAEWFGQEFLTIDLPRNVRTYPKNFWENLVTEIQVELNAKVTGISGPFVENNEPWGLRNFILVFYQPKVKVETKTKIKGFGSTNHSK